MAEHEVWGYKIGRSASGKKIWPNEIKWEATRRIREEGQSAGEVAAELGAHECLVRKWSVADRRSRGEKLKTEGPAFASVSFEDHIPAPIPSTPAASDVGFGRIVRGSVTIEFPLGISESELAKLIMVAGQAQ